MYVHRAGDKSEMEGVDQKLDTPWGVNQVFVAHHNRF